MDKGADTTQRIIVTIAVILGILIVLTIGYSLYQKAKVAEGQLANKEALDASVNKNKTQTNITLTGEAKNSSNFNYDGLIQKGTNEETASTSFEVVNEVIEKEPVVETTPIIEPEPEPTPVPTKTVVTPKPAVTTYDDDRPLTEAEIRAIRQLPVDNSPSGKLQNALEEYSNGQYKANY